MAASLNKVMLMGNLGQDPEVRTLQNGSQVANMSIATSETWRDKQTGERREKTEWHRVVVWNEGLIRIIQQYLHKGDTVLIEGQLQTRKWQDQSGQDRYSTEIVLKAFDGKLTMVKTKRAGDGDAGERVSHAAGNSGVAPGKQNDLDDEIPF